MSRSSTPALELDPLREKLEGLGLAHAAEALEETVRDGVVHDRPGHELLRRLIETETVRRDERRIKTALKLSGFPGDMTLENFEYGFQPGIDRKRIESLATGSFIRDHTNILFQGPPGVGKTHLAVALGIRAIELGFSVGFYRLEDLLFDMRKDADVPPAKLRRKRYFHASYLVIDEVGFESMNQADASLFFRLISHRYGRGSIALTTNKSVKDWPGIFAGDTAMTSAILDRLLHNSAIFNIKGRSYRLQGLENLLTEEEPHS